jgi:hypothetical protein
MAAWAVLAVLWVDLMAAWAVLTVAVLTVVVLVAAVLAAAVTDNYSKVIAK